MGQTVGQLCVQTIKRNTKRSQVITPRKLTTHIMNNDTTEVIQKRYYICFLFLKITLQQNSS